MATVTCPECGRSLGIPPKAYGKKARCPACGATVKIPAAEHAPETEKEAMNMRSNLRESRRPATGGGNNIRFRPNPAKMADDDPAKWTESTAWVVGVLWLLCVVSGVGAIIAAGIAFQAHEEIVKTANEAALNAIGTGNYDAVRAAHMRFPAAGRIAIVCIIAAPCWAMLATCVKTHFERLAQIVKALSSDKTPPK